MKLKIEMAFIDRHTGERREAGSIVDFDEDRAAELLADPRGFVKQIEEEPKEEPKEEPVEEVENQKPAPKKRKK